MTATTTRPCPFIATHSAGSPGLKCEKNECRKKWLITERVEGYTKRVEELHEYLNKRKQLPLLFLGRAAEFNVEIVTCDHFSSQCFGVDDERIVEMQETVEKSQDGILKGRAIDYLMRNFNQETIIEQESTAVEGRCVFSVDGPQKNVRILS